MDKFTEASVRIGNNLLNVQGPGGNSSMKAHNKIYIKASGKRMDDTNTKDGLSICNFQQLLEFIRTKKRYSFKDEEKFLEIINLSKEANSPNPSMEIGFHIVISSKYVFHLHSVYANIFLCMKGGSKFLKKIFKDTPHVFVDYKNPGYELSLFISKLQVYPNLIFLKNHGIIIHSDNLKECLEMSELINKRIENFLNEKEVYTPFVLNNNFKISKRLLFPDAAVFSMIDLELLSKNKKRNVLEIFSAQDYIIKNIGEIKRKPVYLKKDNINKLLNMKQEKLRQKLQA